jgi:alpha-ketoglutarate-dependent taurine dioxygenase
MAVFDSIANSDALALRIRLRRGDVALVNNLNLFHRWAWPAGAPPRG